MKIAPPAKLRAGCAPDCEYNFLHVIQKKHTAIQKNRYFPLSQWISATRSSPSLPQLQVVQIC